MKRWRDVDSDASVPLLKVEQTSITNSVCACRHINSFVSAPLNSTKIVGMKRIHLRMVMVDPEFFYIRSTSVEKGDFFREVTPRSLFYGHLKAIFWQRLLPRAVTWRHSGINKQTGYLASRYAVLEAEWLLRRAVRAYYRRGTFCGQFFAKFNDTACVYNWEPERSRVTRPAST